MLVGYSRTALVQPEEDSDQELEALKNYGCLEENIYQEQTASSEERYQLHMALNCLRKDDKFVVNKLSSLGYQPEDFEKVFQHIEKKSSYLVILDIAGQQLDSTTKNGQTMLASLKAMAGINYEYLREKKLEDIRLERDKLT